MNWDDFDVFCRVVEHGGFTAAARFMQRPTSSLSASVARLEAQLGTRLLERTTRRVRLTETGEMLYGDVARPFAQLREVALEAVARGNTVHGTLRIAAPYEFGAHHLAEPACRIMQQYAALKVEIDVEHAKVDMFARHYDLVFSATDHGLPSSSVVARRVFTLERGVFAAPALVRRDMPATPDDLRRLPLLAGLEDDEWSFTDGAGGTQVIRTDAPRMRSGNADVRLQAAIAGLGVIRVTATFCDQAIRAGRLVRLLPGYRCAPLKIFAQFPQRRLMPAKVRIFLDTLDAFAGPEPADA